MTDLIVVNVSNDNITIQTQMISAAGGMYTVPFADISNWATDPYLRAYLLAGKCYIVSLGVSFNGIAAADWMDAIFRGSIIFAS